MKVLYKYFVVEVKFLILVVIIVVILIVVEYIYKLFMLVILKILVGVENGKLVMNIEIKF